MYDYNQSADSSGFVGFNLTAEPDPEKRITDGYSGAHNQRDQAFNSHGKDASPGNGTIGDGYDAGWSEVALKDGCVPENVEIFWSGAEDPPQISHQGSGVTGATFGRGTFGYSLELLKSGETAYTQIYSTDSAPAGPSGKERVDCLTEHGETSECPSVDPAKYTRNDAELDVSAFHRNYQGVASRLRLNLTNRSDSGFSLYELKVMGRIVTSVRNTGVCDAKILPGKGPYSTSVWSNVRSSTYVFG